MDRTQAKRLIIDTFENPFDKGKFIEFIANLLKNYDRGKAFSPRYGTQGLTERYLKYIKGWERIGVYEEEDKRIDILIVELQKDISLYRARSNQRNFVAEYLQGRLGTKNYKDAALVAFVAPNNDDWRFSLVKMDYRFEETPTGKIKVKEEFTPARRWSFLVGKNEKSHTAQSRFIPILENDDWRPTLEDLEQAFNVEVVTREFFEKYRDLFIRTKSELDKILHKDTKVNREFKNKKINTVDFVKKLLGQITFLYFLQKKGWFGVEKGKHWGTGPRDFIRKLFDRNYGKYKNFYNDILEPLFYEALRTDRSDADHYFSRFDCKLPFLNGGLFDPLNNYNWVDVDILLPNELFSNQKPTKEGDIGDGILDVFDRFNFTVNEDEPLEKEVALDPELLGKIYEKLNAIRQDNFDEYQKTIGKKGEETKFNKEYGVYYTPREIVHYMCQQSLINYIETELNKNIPGEDIEKFINLADSIHESESVAIEKEKKIRNGEQKTTKYESRIPESIKTNAQKIDELLANIKVCDPAVGSGAFPIGMMHEIVRLRQLLSIYSGKIVSSYELKRHCIENSLYGVDIDPGAVEICKLRFWLSMIVDEEDFYNIKPLPNLDYKVVCGNSLIGFPENWNSAISKRIEQLKKEFFKETRPAEKGKLKKEIDDLIDKRLANSERYFGYKINFDFKTFFSEVFNQKGGFDILIANPPYIQLQKEGGRLASLYKNQNFTVFDRMGDIYTLFYEKGINILKQGGILCYITSNKWMRAGYGEKLRQFFLKYNPLNLIDLGPGVFESATVDTNILIIQKADNQNRLKAVTLNKINNETIDIQQYFNDNAVTLEKLTQDAWFIGSSAEQKLKEKIERIGKPLKDWDVKIYYGIKTGLNEAFIIDNAKCEEILNNCKDEEERKRTEAIIKPILRGRDIKRYYYEWAGLWVIVIPAGWTNQNKGNEKPDRFIEKQFSSLMQHLKKYEEKAIKRDDQGDYWWELRHCAYYPEFEKEKVVWQELAQGAQFSYDNNGEFYVSNTAYILTGNKIKFILGYLNSKLNEYTYDKWYCTKLGEKGTRWLNQHVQEIPIPPITPSNQPIVSQIEQLVDKILSAKKQNPQANTVHLEQEIDRLVYELYGLTEEEMGIVERR